MKVHDPKQWIASERLALHALSVSADALTLDARTAIRNFTLDTIGVGIGGVRSPYASALLASVKGWGAGAEAAVWASATRLPTAHAAFMNAFLIHCQEFDAVHEAAVLHPFTVVTPVLLAEAETRRMDGATYVAACAAGVDVAVTLGAAATSQIRFFRPATCGLFGAVAALARARQLSRAQTIHAFGYALALASGTMQAHVEGTPALAVQVANAARSAFASIEVAAAGLPGPLGAIDGRFGYLSLFEESHDIAPQLEALGTIWRATEVSWKPYPTGRAAHGGVDMVRQLRARGVSAENLETLTVHVPPLIAHLVGRPIVSPLEVNYARLCLPYVMGVAFGQDTVTLADFSPEALGNEQTHALARRIELAPLANPNPAAFVPQRAVAKLFGGAEIEAEVVELPGSPRRPLTRAQHLGKFRANVAFGRLDAARSEELIGMVDELETLPDVGAVSRAAA